MAGPILHPGAMLLCPHGGQVQFSGTSGRVSLGGQPALTIDDGFAIAGCPFCTTVGTQLLPQPCTRVMAMAGAKRVTIGGRPAALADGSGVCATAQDLPRGPAVLLLVQSRVLAL